MSGPSRKRLRTLDDHEETNEAACGVIQRVTMKNFMCHEHLAADFSDKINLVQGRNGSGKSAILTAVVVALGGSTRTTNRGSSLKELIKYDKRTASVELVLKNGGKDAYKHETYGDTITIERKISDSGGNSYSIKAYNGKVVSVRKEELKRICDFYNLNVENPLTVLNQDMSRSFLNSADPRNLYKFFYQATQLQQMADYYSQLNDCLEASSSIIKDRMAVLPIVEREVQELHNRYQFCLKHSEKRLKLKDLRRELAWAKISHLERQKEVAEENLNKLLTYISQVEEKQSTCQVQAEESKKIYKEVVNRFDKITEELNTHRMNYKKKNEDHLKSKAKMKDMQREVEKERRNIEKIDRDIGVLNETIRKDHTEAQQIWEEQHKQHQEEIRTTEIQVNEVEQVKKTEETHLLNVQNTYKVKLENRQQLQFESNMKKRSLLDLETELKDLQSQNTNAFTVFGQWVQPLLDRIDQAFRQRKFSARPVGPLGAYIEMKDSQWTHIAEQVIGSRISSFIVNNSQDERVLRSLFQGINFGSNHPTIISCRFRPRHNADLIAAYEVQSPTYSSLWSAMNIKDDIVANFIIDRCQVETVLLIPTADEAGQILKHSETVPRNCRIAYTLNGDRYFPDPNYKVYSGAGQRRARFLQISVGERAEEVDNEIGNFKEEMGRISQQIRSIDSELQELKGQENKSLQKLRKHKSDVQRLRALLNQLSNQVGPAPPPNVSQLEEDLKSHQAIKSAALQRYTDLQDQLQKKEQEYAEAQGTFKGSNSTLAEQTQKAHLLEKEMQEAEEKANKYMHTSDLLKKRLKDQEKKKNDLQKNLLEEENKLKGEMKIAENFLPRIDTERSPSEIERQYKTFEEKLTREQEQRGDPVKVAEEFKDKREKFLKMKAELEDCRNLVSKLEQTLRDRWSMGRNFRKTLSILVKTSFSEALTSRHLKGKILFDFEKETLSIHVLKEGGSNEIQDFDASSQSKTLKKSQQEKLAMMSGGERSFSTVALILSLWGVMDSPLRILDEFDVFMDIIARRQSLDMMISAAKPKTQYIYLTPLEVNRQQHSTELNVFRMPDPERLKTTEMSQ